MNPAPYSEDDLLPLSALQHLLYCERRAALVHVEGLWAENVATLEGNHLHEKVDLPGQSAESRNDLRIVRGVPLRSFTLGLSGKADVVEFHQSDAGIALPRAEGLWHPFPVEYKRGAMRSEPAYEVQLCAQALCLEEMLSVRILAGAIFFGTNRRRLPIPFDEDLRSRTATAAHRLHELIARAETPMAVREPKCERCSMLELCMPDAMARAQSVYAYIQRSTREQRV